MTPDAELLRQYAELNSEEAFAELVRRHLDLVYSTAMRQVNGDAHLAQDVAQGVFTDLARKAAKLSRHPTLSGWLYTSAYFASCKAARAERRRHAREQEAQAMQELLQSSSSGTDWDKVRPVLDQAMHELNERECTAILMRYFENRAFAEIGAQLGLSEDAARKRVDRALARLQTLLAKRGPATGAALAATLSVNAIQTSPAGLAATLTSASLSSAAANTSSVTTLLKLMAATKFQTAILSTIVLASVLTPFALQHQAQARLHEKDEALQQQTTQIMRLTAENERLTRLAAQAGKSSPSAEHQLQELLKLRSEVGRLRKAVEEMTDPKPGMPLSREEKLAELKQKYAEKVARLKEWLEANPSEKIPEFEHVSQEDWLTAAHALGTDYDLGSDYDCERAISNLRANSELRILDKLRAALRKYTQDNNGEFPSNVAGLKPYLKSPIDDAILQRYVILQANNLVSELQPGGDWVITQAVPVNPALDSRMAYGLTGMRSADERVTNRWNLVH